MARTRLIAAMILTYVGFAMLLNSVGTVILQSISSFGVTKPQASTLEGFKDITIALVSFATASYLARIGLRKALIGALLLAIAACLVMPMLGSFGAAQLHFAMVGAAFAVAKVAVYSMIGFVTAGPRQHASLTSLIEGMFMLGVLASYWVFSAFIDPTGLRWLNAYWVLAGIVALALALLLSSRVDEAPAGEEPAVPEAAPFRAMLRLAALPLVLVFVLCAFVFVVIEQGIGTWLPTFNNEVLHLPAQMSVQAASLFAACIALGRFGAGAVMARFDWYPVLNACLILLAALIILVLPLADGLSPRPIAGWGDAPVAAFLFPLIGFALAPIYPTIISVMLSAMPGRQHPPLMGLVVVFSALGGTTGSVITGQLFAHLDGRTAFTLMLVPTAILGIGLFLLRRQIAVKDTAS
ncbi:MFS transporter [Sphingopyxis alaskensis]|jgi:MFS transporter, FHS family, glucose/mannose:H+ symporter|uniref:Major facilitator superfamily MFS_1 n=1 Tax=Sphingopyxis alaskensis (strain DSM 13593 / LMG 18877 / RB2256) TaxID=317655 RepID=Q1GWE3_SPHAL|nr:MFS transporter [Sphingopyxis alaskensis]ABF52029.1 major facilitator superfamily MFS_1 [Sphingopyxis alaskensis RB2256]MCM3419279.1 MFS transporter [Sphingopyxis alaskensis]